MNKPVSLKPTLDLDDPRKEPCCPQWSQIQRSFGWHVLEENRWRKIMPYILVGNNRWLINYCPSCGAYVRDIVEINHD